MDFVSRKTGTHYSALLESISAKNVRMKDWLSLDSTRERYFVLRHDVDGDFATAMKMARFEYDCGIHATYFLHAHRSYFDWTPDSSGFLDALHKMQDLGHDIGWHNDALARHLEKPQTVPVLMGIRRPLRFLRENDIEVKGCSCHGSKICKDNRLSNNDIWIENPFVSIAQRGTQDFTHYSLLQFGLDYEAYFLKRTAYLSDNHGGWSGGVGDEIEPFEVPGKVDNTVRDDIIERFNAQPWGMLQILMHPQHWRAV